MTRKTWLIASLMLIPMAFYSGWILAAAGIFTTCLYIVYYRYNQLHATAMTLSANWHLLEYYGGDRPFIFGPCCLVFGSGIKRQGTPGKLLCASLGIKKGNPFLRLAFLSAATMTGVLLLTR